MEEMELIAVRIKDGIFAGNVAAAEDHDFLSMNKITHVINCAGGEVADFFVGDPELRYLSFPWKDAAGSVCTTVLFDSNDDNINKAIQFIDEAMDAGECVLVHSYHGISRSPALIAAYFIVKYGWKLESALSFLRMAHPDVNIKPHFLRQLRQFAKRHQVDCDVFDRAVDDSRFGLDNDQWMLRNTLLNGLAAAEQESSVLFQTCVSKVDVGARVGKEAHRKLRISFVDTKQGTDVDAAGSTPVVPGKSIAAAAATVHADSAAASDGVFVGAQGPAALRAGRRSPSIVSRSTSPCTRHLESDPNENPKGRQHLKLLVPERPPAASSTQSTPVKAPRSAAAAAKPGSARAQLVRQGSAPISPAAAAASASTTSATPTAADKPRDSKPTSARGLDAAAEDPAQGRVSYYERLAPPKPKPAGTSGSGTPARSPLATLSSKHKFRNGSPLPLTKEKEKEKSKSKIRPRSASSSSKDRTGSPTTKGTVSSGGVTRSRAASGGGGGASAGAGVTRGADSRYQAIAPQRGSSASGRPAWSFSIVDDRNIASRTASQPRQRTNSSGRREPQQRSRSARSRTSSVGDKDGRPRPARRDPSKQGRRTGSPGSNGPSTRATASPTSSNNSFSSAPERTASPSKRVVKSTSPAKLRRQPPEAIPSRRQ